jgi:hypothetical protein
MKYMILIAAAVGLSACSHDFAADFSRQWVGIQCASHDVVNMVHGDFHNVATPSHHPIVWKCPDPA